jgi:acetyltransferase-like isoleucine patch superfamily enzyme
MNMGIRWLIKRSVLALAVLLVSPLIVLARAERALTGGEHLFVAFGQALALLPGRSGSFLRLGYYRFLLEQCSSDAVVGFGSYFSHRRARVGRNVSIGAYCVLGMADVGDDVMVASRVSIPSGKRQHIDAQGRITRDTHFESVRIGAGSWVGEGAIVLAPVGEACIVSAGAVVLKPVPPRCLAGGNPAQVVRELDAATSPRA